MVNSLPLNKFINAFFYQLSQFVIKFMNNSDCKQNTKFGCDSQNLQFGCNSQINLPRDCADQPLSYC